MTDLTWDGMGSELDRLRFDVQRFAKALGGHVQHLSFETRINHDEESKHPSGATIFIDLALPDPPKRKTRADLNTPR